MLQSEPQRGKRMVDGGKVNEVAVSEHILKYGIASQHGDLFLNLNFKA
jgi:hypothetical protein